jgi:integrase
MAQAGVPIEQIAQYLGHTNPAVTYRVYARYSPEHLRKASDALRLGDEPPAIEDKRG